MAKQNSMGELGYSGLNEWHGMIQEDFLREMRGAEAYKRYTEMRLNSPIIGALLMAAELSIRGIDWNYVSDYGDEDQRIGFLEGALNGMSHTWQDHVIEALSFMVYGYSPFETVYKRSAGGGIVWRKFAIRGQDTVYRWMMDDAGGLAGLVQRGAPKYELVEIPIDKMVLYRSRVEKNNPEGRSLLRTAWVPYYYLKNIQQIEAIGLERDLAGLPVITLPEGATTDANDSTSDYSKAAKHVRNLRNDEQAGMVLSPGWELELLSTGGSRQFDTNAIIMRYESRILMSALAQFLILGQDKVGTQALSSDMTEFWTMAVNSLADIISETHTRYAMARLLALNGMDTEGIRMEHSPAGDVDLAALGDFFQKAGDKLTWLSTDEMWLRAAAKLPEVTPEQIEEEKQRRLEQQQALFEQRAAANPNPFQRDDNTAEYFASEPPDEGDRKRAERQYQQAVSRAFKAQEKRILKEVSK